ncbi:MAG: CHAD domain-containing protein [Usitatibacteraceae bacterium]
MPDIQEIEFKFAIAPEDASAFRKLAFLREHCIEGPRRRKLLNIYFDTPALVLNERAMALRLRKAGGAWAQTLKTAGMSTAGLHQRAEWEFVRPAPELDLALFLDTPLVSLPGAADLHLTLKPVFTTDFFRTTWLIETAPGQRVEVALDQGAVRCGELTMPISEVEIELKEGDVASVFDVALALVSGINLRPEHVNKAERGYRLLQPAASYPQRARAVEIKRKWPVCDAMHATFTACIDHVEANVDGTIYSDDIEYLHQLRVALRRLRSAIRIFRPAHAENIDAELKWLTGELGAARDWDVLVTETLPTLLDAYSDPQFTAATMQAAAARNSAARDAARTALRSRRANLLRVALARWVSVPGELALPVPEASETEVPPPENPKLSPFAAQKIRRAFRRVSSVEGTLSVLPADARHRVRIDCKKLRYAVDFLGSLFDKKSVTRYSVTLGKIQDLLGETNDGAVAMGLLSSLAPPDSFMEFARGWFAARTWTALREVDSHFVKLKALKRF